MGKSSNNEYNVVVIGGGPGGYVAAVKAAKSGLKVALIEKDNIGGTCLNYGCLPTKAILRSVESFNEIKRANDYGIGGLDEGLVSVNMERVQEIKQEKVAKLTGGVMALINYNGIKFIKGEARILDKNTIATEDSIITSDNIIIATGSRVKELAIPLSPRMEVLTSKEMLAISEIPDAITIIGGGVIGIEFAYMLANLGSKVTVFEYLNSILPMVDEEITNLVTNYLLNLGVEIHVGAKVQEVTDEGIKYIEEGEERFHNTKKILMAVGRESNTGGVDCKALGISMEGSSIVTDNKLRTSVENIYAIGDVNGKHMLAHTATAEALVAVENICGLDTVMDYSIIPNAIYIQPEISSVGLTESQAREKYDNINIGKFPLWANGKAEASSELLGMIKVVSDSDTDKILGVHICSSHATELISEVVIAMRLGATVRDVAMSIHPHPTFSEALNEAMHATIGEAIHLV